MEDIDTAVDEWPRGFSTNFQIEKDNPVFESPVYVSSSDFVKTLVFHIPYETESTRMGSIILPVWKPTIAFIGELIENKAASMSFLVGKANWSAVVYLIVLVKALWWLWLCSSACQQLLAIINVFEEKQRCRTQTKSPQYAHADRINREWTPVSGQIAPLRGHYERFGTSIVSELKERPKGEWEDECESTKKAREEDVNSTAINPPKKPRKRRRSAAPYLGWYCQAVWHGAQSYFLETKTKLP